MPKSDCENEITRLKEEIASLKGNGKENNTLIFQTRGKKSLKDMKTAIKDLLSLMWVREVRSR